MNFFKRTGKVFALVLALSMLMTTAVFAEEPATEDISGTYISAEEEYPQAFLDRIYSLISTVSENRVAYEMENVDFGNLYLGEKIQPYKQTETGYVADQIYFYPVFSGNDVFAIITVSETNDEPAIQLAKSFSDNLNRALSEENELKFIYTDNDFCALGNSTHLLINADGVSSANDFSGDISALETFHVENKVCLPNFEVMPLADSGKMLNVAIRSQNSSALCWAAAVSSVGHYRTGVSKNIYDIADIVENHGGATIEQTSVALRQVFGISNGITNAGLKFSSVKGQIDGNRPMITLLRVSNPRYLPEYHFVTVRGYSGNSDTGIISIMDSDNNNGLGGYAACSINNNNVLGYTKYANNEMFTYTSVAYIYLN